MRLLIVTTGYPRQEGDLFGNFVQDLAQTLAEDGVKVRVLAPHEKGLPWLREEKGVQVYRLPYFFPAWESVAYGGGIPSNLKHWSCRLQLPFFMFFMGLWTLVLGRGQQIVHAQWGVSGLWALAVRLFCPVAVVVTFLGSDLHGNRIFKAVSKWVAKRSDANIMVSLEQMTQMPQAHNHHIPNPLDTSRFYPLTQAHKNELKKELGFKDGVPLLLFVGMLVPVKQVDFILRSLYHVKEPWQLAVVGDGPLAEELKALARALKIDSKVTFVGFVDYAKVHHYFQACDVHVMASLGEGRPNVIYQAMACAVGGVYTAVGGIAEMVEKDKSALLPAAKEEDYAQALSLVLQSSAKREEMGKRALEKLSQLGVLRQRVAEQHFELYKELIASRLE